MAEVLEKYVGRLAPSPTGALHLGNVRTFMIAWLRARAQGGKVIMRMEDLDHPKDKPGAASAAREDLQWLGFDWDEEYVQSERKRLYREAIGFLSGRGLAYPCVCSRKDVEHAQSAPHAGEQLHYPGLCRGRFPDWSAAQSFLDGEAARVGQPAGRRTPCWRFRVNAGTCVAFDDVFAGHVEQEVAQVLGDFPLARDEGRGDDLLAATPAQLLVAEALGEHFAPSRPRPPAYCHVPLVVGPDGRRLAKRHGDTRVASFRAAGVSPETLLGRLAASCGWVRPGEAISLRDLLPRFRLDTIPRTASIIRKL